MLLLAVLAASSLAAAEPIRLSLNEAVRLALQNSAAPQLARSNEERARALVSAARSGLLPEAQARLLRYNQSINLATFGFTIPGQPVVIGPFNVTDAQIAAAMNLFDLSALRQYEAAREGVRATRFQREQTEDDVAAAAARLYVLLQKVETEISVREANIKLFEELRRVANDQLQAGTGIRLDVARAEVQLSREKQALLVADNQRDAVRLALLHVIGADQSSEVILTDSPQRPAAIPDAASAVTTAIQNRPDIKQLESRRQQADLAVQAARDARLPTVGVDLLGDLSGNRTDDLHWSRRLGIGATIPILSGGRIAARVAEAKVARYDVDVQATEARRQIEEDVRRSVMTIENTLARIDLAAENVKVAEEELSVARDRVANGVGSTIEIDRAQDSYRQAREDQIAAQSDAALAEIDFERATGSIRHLVDEASKK
jgi:outer membrane protein